jgi:hypothetical protein
MNKLNLITIISIFDKHEDFIELQYKSILKNIEGTYEYIIFNNASSDIQRDKILKTCNNLKIKCIDVYANYNSCPSGIAGTALNESFKYLNDKIVFKLDSDMFFINKFNLNEMLNDIDLLYVPNKRISIGEFAWSGVFGINLQNIKECLNFLPGIIPNTDTFGQSVILFNNSKYIKKSLHLLNLQKVENSIYTTAINNDCLFIFNSSNQEISVDNDLHLKQKDYDDTINKIKCMENILIKNNFPTPYNIDLIYYNDKEFIFHFKSANWCPWYTEDYVNLKKQALIELLEI